MTERTHGLVLGKFTAGFIGLVAMAALVTGAVAAANVQSPSVAVADAPATPTATATQGAPGGPKVEITENPSFEASEHPSGGPESIARPKLAASCDPSLDAKEDLAELAAKGQKGDNDADDNAPDATATPTVSRTPEPSEPPSCYKVDPDGHGALKSGKTAEPSGHPGGNEGPGHDGLKGTFIPSLPGFHGGH
jgi:hypothetical protein